MSDVKIISFNNTPYNIKDEWSRNNIGLGASSLTTEVKTDLTSALNGVNTKLSTYITSSSSQISSLETLVSAMNNGGLISDWNQ